MRYAVALCVALLLNAAANLLMKVGMKSVAGSGGLLRDGPIAAAGLIVTSGVLLTGLICFGLNAVCYMYALQSKSLPISVAYPIMVGGGFVLIALVARFHPALAERLSAGQLTGIAMILVGIVLVVSQGTRSAT